MQWSHMAMPMRLPHFDIDTFAIRITLNIIAVQTQEYFKDCFSV